MRGRTSTLYALNCDGTGRTDLRLALPIPPDLDIETPNGEISSWPRLSKRIGMQNQWRHQGSNLGLGIKTNFTHPSNPGVLWRL